MDRPAARARPSLLINSSPSSPDPPRRTRRGLRIDAFEECWKNRQKVESGVARSKCCWGFGDAPV